MEQVIKQYGKFLMEGVVLVALLVILFAGIRDGAGNQGVFHIVGARLPTGGIDYESYSDFDDYRAESSKMRPKIEYSGGILAVGVVKLSNHIHATDHAGHDLQIKVTEIINPDGDDITGTLHPDTKISLDIPGVYSVRLRAVDSGGRKTVCTMSIAVKEA